MDKMCIDEKDGSHESFFFVFFFVLHGQFHIRFSTPGFLFYSFLSGMKVSKFSCNHAQFLTRTCICHRCGQRLLFQTSSYDITPGVL